MAGLGAATGGPMGMRPESLGNADVTHGSKALLNTYIHNYFVEEGLVEIAKNLRGSGLDFNQKLLKKTGPGADEAMETDSKDDPTNRVDGLPGSNNQAGSVPHNFLPNWWGIFYDMWSAARNKTDSASSQYLAAIQRQRQQQNNPQLVHQNMINPNRFAQYQTMISNNTMNNLPRKAMANSGIHPNMNNNIANMRMHQLAQQNPMQRDGSDMDMNGVPRGPSPRPGESAPSPKRQRVDSGASNFPRMMPNGRPVGMVQQPPNGNAPNATMLMGEPFGGAVSPAFNQLNNPPKTAEQMQYAHELSNQHRLSMQHVKGGPGGLMNQGSPLLHGGPENQLMNSEMFAANPYMRQQGPAGAGAGGHGGALADYQMQLMLLEQQNKKRLMMARQEQDVAQREQGVPQGLMGQTGYAPPMSPRASRTGHSPNSDPTKRGTPKMGQDSPLPDNPMGTNRGSPGGGAFEPGQMPPNMMPAYAMAAGPVGAPNGMMVRPPNMPGMPMSQQQVEIMRRQQQQQLQQQQMGMHNGQWPPGMQNQGPMLSQPIQQTQVENNQPRNSMPPPQGPPNGRTQPSSPQTQPAPPTPSQANKPPPKKKDSKDTKKKPPKKAATTTGATPNAEVEQSDDVPPPTPSTPNNKASSIIKGNAPPMNMTSQPNPPMPNVLGMPQQMENNGMAGPFGALDPGTDMDSFENFGDLLNHDNSDVLQGFDFEAFLYNEPVNNGIDVDAQYFGGDGLETGMGD